MRIRDQRPHFFVYTLFRDSGASQRHTLYLKAAGYEAFAYSSEAELIERVRESNPHFVVLDLTSLDSNMSDFVETLLKVAPETQYLVMATDADFEVLNEYRDYGLVEIVNPSHMSEKKVLAVLDRAAEKLYYRYQNEQILEDLRQKEGQLSVLEKDLKKRERPLFVEAFTSAEVNISRESLIQKFFDFVLKYTPEVKGVYFKYLPPMQSFVVTQTLSLASDEVKGVGFQLASAEISSAELGQVQNLLSMKKLMREAFGVADYDVQKLNLNSALEGLLVLWPSGHVRPVDFSLFCMVYENKLLEQKVTELDVRDPQSELFTSIYYYQKLEEEISRARRIEKPISVIRFEIDSFKELKASLGDAVMNSIVRTMGLLIKKNCRANDFVCRLKENDFAIVLPNAPAKGAAVKAERVRRLIETHAFTSQSMHITISAGISEFPSLCASAQDLDASAARALSHITQKGENKICLFKAPAQFQPEYVVEADFDRGRPRGNLQRN